MQPSAPILILDSHEIWRPCPVEESLATFGYNWVVGEGWAQDNGHMVDRINLPPRLRPADYGGLPVVGYHRAVNGGPLVWHQFWTWWLYNPKKYAGFGEHEGDWEMCQIGVDLGDHSHAVLMSCAQHDGGEKREFWRVSLDSPRSLESRPKVYLARDSHAAYFEVHNDVTDQADGEGLVLDQIEWREFGPWANWSGRWGNSDNSPGPLATRRVWQAPHAWHGQARG